MSWVVVVGDDDVSRRQLEVCRAQRPEQVRGAVRCDDLDTHLHPICAAVPRFPVFCDLQSNACAPAGLREAPEDFAALSRVEGAPGRTTGPATPR